MQPSPQRKILSLSKTKMLGYHSAVESFPAGIRPRVWCPTLQYSYNSKRPWVVNSVYYYKMHNSFPVICKMPQRRVERPIIKPKGLYPPRRLPVQRSQTHDIRISLMMALEFLFSRHLHRPLNLPLVTR